MMMCALVFACFLFLWITPDVYADGSKSLALEVVLAQKSDQLINQDFQETIKLQAQHIESRLSSSGLNEEEVKAGVNKVNALVSKYLNWERMSDRVVEIYSKVYSDEELNGLLDFFNTEIGSKVAVKQGPIMKESAKFSRELVAEMMPELQELLADLTPDTASSRHTNLRGGLRNRLSTAFGGTGFLRGGGKLKNSGRGGRLNNMGRGSRLNPSVSSHGRSHKL